MEVLKCLLIDDDIEEHLVFGMALADFAVLLDYSAHVSGVEALEALRSEPESFPDFIFLDINTPYMNGIECLMELKKIDHLKNTQIIIYSSSNSEIEINKSRECGASYFVSKPNRVEDLIGILSSFFLKETLPFYIKTNACV